MPRLTRVAFLALAFACVGAIAFAGTGAAAVDEPTPTPAVEQTDEPELRLTSICVVASDDPSALFRVSNTHASERTVRYDVYGSDVAGTVDVPAGGVAYFAVPQNGPTTARLSVDGEQVDVKAATSRACTRDESNLPVASGAALVVDRDGDGKSEDVNGDGAVNYADVEALTTAIERGVTADGSPFLDHDTDGDLDSDDVRALARDVRIDGDVDADGVVEDFNGDGFDFLDVVSLLDRLDGEGPAADHVDPVCDHFRTFTTDGGDEGVDFLDVVTLLEELAEYQE